MLKHSDSASIYSIFSNEGDSHSISLSKLELIVREAGYLEIPESLDIQLRKLAEGGNHKVDQEYVQGDRYCILKRPPRYTIS